MALPNNFVGYWFETFRSFNIDSVCFGWFCCDISVVIWCGIVRSCCLERQPNTTSVQQWKGYINEIEINIVFECMRRVVSKAHHVQWHGMVCGKHDDTCELWMYSDIISQQEWPACDCRWQWPSSTVRYTLLQIGRLDDWKFIHSASMNIEQWNIKDRHINADSTQ